MTKESKEAFLKKANETPAVILTQMYINLKVSFKCEDGKITEIRYKS
ncbi:hypothetical protein [Clostridium lundense]|nr:hypothetical protein [Clostridium lundense]